MILVPTAFMVKLHEISVEPYVPHAVFVPFIGLTSLRTDSGLPTIIIHSIHRMIILLKVYFLMFAVVFFFYNKNEVVHR